MASINLHRLTRNQSQSITTHILSKRYISSPVIKSDAICIGGGIAGASVSYQLAKLQNLNVTLLEKEQSAGWNTTGRAFGIFAQSNARTLESKILTAASRPFFDQPDEECMNYDLRNSMSENPILSQTGLLAVSTSDDYSYLYKEFGPREGAKFDQDIEIYPCDTFDVTKLVPWLNKDNLAQNALYEPAAANFNTGLVYEHFLIGGENVGVNYAFNQTAVEMNKNANGNWEIMTYDKETNEMNRFECGILVNCCGKMCDDTALKAQIQPIGLQANKRNVIVFTYHWENNDDLKDIQTPWIGFVSPTTGELFHSCFQGNNGVFVYDKTMDARMRVIDHDDEDNVNLDEMEIVLQKLRKHTNLKVDKMASKSAGIRCAVKDDYNMVIGPDERDNSFVWCAALSGYGVQTSPAYSEIVSYLACGKEVPEKYVDMGLDVNKLLPSRLRGNVAKAQ